MKRLALLVFALSVMWIGINPCQASSQWAMTLGGEFSDEAWAVQETSDGGYVIGGGTNSYGENGDILVIKLDKYGDISWAKTYGGPPGERLWTIQQTSDEGYIIGATGGGVGQLVLKVDRDGDIVWQRAYGNMTPRCIRQTEDGGYIIAGDIAWSGWVIKLDSDGDVVWHNQYGIGWNTDLYSVQQTRDRGYIIAGGVHNDPNAHDFWVMKLDEDGNTLWQKTYGGSAYEVAASIQQTEDLGYIVAGLRESFPRIGQEEAWVLKLDTEGNILWQNAYGGDFRDYARFIIQTPDRGYIFAGTSRPFGSGDPACDGWVTKLDEDGNIVWQRLYNGGHTDIFRSIGPTSDGGCVVAGTARYIGPGEYDFFLLKLDDKGRIRGCDLIGDGVAVSSPTSIEGQDSNATIRPVSTVVTDTNVSAQDVSVGTSVICIGPPTIIVDVDIRPNVLNLKSRGKWVTCYIELPDGYAVEDIEVGTVMLEDTISAETSPTEVGDSDQDGIPDLMVKFDREALIEYLDGTTGEVALTVAGEVDGKVFGGGDTIRVIGKGKSKGKK